jgi:hypothetical protein
VLQVNKQFPNYNALICPHEAGSINDGEGRGAVLPPPLSFNIPTVSSHSSVEPTPLGGTIEG